MARRVSWNFWSNMVEHGARSVLSGAGRATKKWLRSSLRSEAAANLSKIISKNPQKGWKTGVTHSLAGVRKYGLYRPPHLPAKKACPMVVMLHGCDQNAMDFSALTRMNRLARIFGFMVLYPEQDRMTNPLGCWNWFQKRGGRAQLEAASIMAALDHAANLHAVDSSRVAIAGMSAGASMAALTALHFPHRFTAVVMHSGVEPTLVNSSAAAVAAMHGRYRISLRAPKQVLNLPALLVIQGNLDPVVSQANGLRAAQIWAAHAQAQPEAARLVQRGKRYSFFSTDWFVGKQLQVTLHAVNGLGHAWSGGAASQAYSDPKGPDASRMVWAFAQQQFETRIQSNPL
ncbi:PHB depolymerase family esterase [Limnohabitans sp. T6-5]|uniref:extracellular catalytic domain type 1 short-chain-length polyhydroxyalkanoate depolymerase n=1 Tax=Limnohabitans sp. T6-5 TaxID=1100724 RepID=UPI0011B27B9E|nr:PHB depolymerase family esterase [Limnohabitans sp. T6-5]